jgi:large subunit ribosomal protein L22
METTSIQKFIHTSPRKLRLVADMVRKQEPSRAILTLRFAQKAAAKELSAAINTALANAGQKGLNMEGINFKTIEVNEGPRMKRFRAGARGRAKMYKRRMSHIKIVLSDEIVTNKKKQTKDAAQNVIPNVSEESVDLKAEQPTDLSATPRDDKKEKTVKRVRKEKK